MNREVTKAVILARGLGTRMKRADDAAPIDAGQSRAADTGVKAMIPFGRPFLDYLLSALADAGFRQACLVIGPEHDSVREYYTGITITRIAVEFAIQEKPLGTADAVLAAESFAGDDPFVVINSDNYYPVNALGVLRMAEPPALVAFARRSLVDAGNVSVEKTGRFGALDIDESGLLQKINRSGAGEANDEIFSSMNCWLFTPEIFAACRRVPLSARGELELPQAVELGIREMAMRFRAVKVWEPVLDMSSRGDIASVAARLEGVRVSL